MDPIFIVFIIIGAILCGAIGAMIGFPSGHGMAGAVMGAIFGPIGWAGTYFIVMAEWAANNDQSPAAIAAREAARVEEERLREASLAWQRQIDEQSLQAAKARVPSELRERAAESTRQLRAATKAEADAAWVREQRGE